MADSEYKSALINEARSLTALAIEGALQPVFGRETELLALQDALRSGGSALLVGPSGVGKTALVYGLARSWVGPDERSVFELSTSLLLTGTRYLGEWQSKLNAIVAEAEKRGAILYITDLWNLPTTGRTQQSDTGALDLRPHLLGGRLTLIWRGERRAAPPDGACARLRHAVSEDRRRPPGRA
ncbi:MAG: AAA family ATPase [Deltaproteobacteria bacterium]|nr:AAA family ATPase [Deltaproteobacteria bacterium]